MSLSFPSFCIYNHCMSPEQTVITMLLMLAALSFLIVWSRGEEKKQRNRAHLRAMRAMARNKEE